MILSLTMAGQRRALRAIVKFACCACGTGHPAGERRRANDFYAAQTRRSWVAGSSPAMEEYAE